MDAATLLPWAGAKTRLRDVLLANLPLRYAAYHEPFVGSGALFAELAPMGATLSDGNAELINLYNVVKHKPERLVADYARHTVSREYYYRLRAADRTPLFREWSDVARASRFLFLGRCCYNGGVRVNARGQMNGAYGTPDPRRVRNVEAVWTWHARLRQTRLWHADVTCAEAAIRPGDFVYFDPPYISLAAGRGLRYTAEGFGRDEQARLAQICGRLHRKGAYFMVSNADHPWIRRLFNGYRIRRLSVYRSIAGTAHKRGKAGEVLITNYD